MFDMFNHPAKYVDVDDYSQLQPSDLVRVKVENPVNSGCRGEVVKHDTFGVEVKFKDGPNVVYDRDDVYKLKK